MIPLHVACSADQRYLAHSAAMLRSVLQKRAGEPTVVHFLHGPQLRANAIHQLGRMVRHSSGTFIAHRIETTAIAGLPSWGRIPAVMWHRILLPDLLPDVSRILYLDVDVLVTDSLDELWECDLEEAYVAAVTNVPEWHRFGHAEEIGLPRPESYFNSGVLLMNLTLMRRDRCTEALLRCARERIGDLLWPDQDALNIVLGRKRVALHPRWNLMNSIRQFPWASNFFDTDAIAEAVARPAIVHFEGPADNKPWHVLSQNPYRALYREHRRRTPWPRYRPSGLTPANVTRLVRRRFSTRQTQGNPQSLMARRPV